MDSWETYLAKICTRNKYQPHCYKSAEDHDTIGVERTMIVTKVNDPPAVCRVAAEAVSPAAKAQNSADRRANAITKLKNIMKNTKFVRTEAMR